MNYDSRDASEIARIAGKRAGSRTAQGGAKVTADEIILSIGNSAFALGLYSKLSSQVQGNIFFSPYSISTALAMTYAGSTGRTETEMSEVLGFSINQRRLHRVFHELGESLLTRSNAGENELNIANAIWIQHGYPLLEGFLYTVNENYGEATFELDFQQTEAARERINGWVEEQTREKIKDLLQPGVLTELTRLVLTNAIYFNGTWLEPFKEELTKPKSFYPTKDTQVEVPMMHRVDKFAFYEWPDIQVLELPYSSTGQDGPDLSMVIFLPKENDCLYELEYSITVENIEEWMRNLTTKEVTVSIPRFKVTQSFALGDILQEMGMKAAFSSADADFTKMTSEPGVCIGEVIHKAFVDVNEVGTEAAAATAVVMLAKGPAPEPKVFNADHPFLFMIQDKLTDSILFLGRVSNPTG